MNNVFLITISGIFVVFIVLFILMIVYYLFGFFVNRNKKNIPIPKKTKTIPEIMSKSEKTEHYSNEESDEEIAAITAAVYSFIDGSKFKIKSISKSNNKFPVKNSQSRWGCVSPVLIWRTRK